MLSPFLYIVRFIMAELKIYSVSDEYIKYLRQDERLTIVFDNKEDARSHTRKYLGVAFVKNDFHYFIPFSSPKNSDYQIEADGSRTIRKSIIPIIRMTTTDTVSGEVELKGTLKISNMIPVPEQELTPYQISAETDANYKIVVQKEFEFIRANEKMIMKNASVLYNQKTKADTLYKNKPAPKYLSSTVDFLYAEQRCQCFIDEIIKKIVTED